MTTTDLKGLKTLIVTTEYPPDSGGVGVSSQRIARLLAGVGMDVTVAHARYADGPVLLDEAVSQERDGAVEVLRLSLSRLPCLGDPLYDRQHQAMRRGQELFQLLLGLQRERRFQVLNGLFITGVGREVCAVASLTGARAMVSIRGNDVGKHFFRDDMVGVQRYVLERAHMVTSVAEDLLALAGTICDVEGRSMVIPNSVDPSLVPAPVAAQPEPGIGLTLGSHGIFRFKKGVPVLLKAAAGLRTRGLAPRLLLVGGYKNAREEQVHDGFIQRFGLGESLELTGPLPRPEAVARLGAGCHIAVYPSLFGEGCPSTVLEAMLCGLPVVASDVGGIPALIRHGETGLLVPPGDAAALEKALARLAEEPELRAALGRAARQAVLSRGAEVEANAWCEAYRRALHVGKAGPALL